MSDSVLLGAGHRRVLLDLNARMDALQAGEDQPRVVVLQGPSGVGKSRIVRELYRWWAAHQPPPGYWAPLPEIGAAGPGGIGLGSAAAALANRKVIGPPTEGAIWPAGSLPGFTWWPFNCGSMTTGDAIDVVAQARPSVQAHLQPALLAWRQSATVMQRLGKLDQSAAERFRELVNEGRDELIGQALDALGVVVPGLGLFFDWGTRGYKTVQKKRSETKALAKTVDLAAVTVNAQESAAVQVAEMILATVSPSLPAVVVVEDIHLMGQAFTQFLQVLQTWNPTRPVLIVGTAWPEAHDRATYAAWRDTALSAGQLMVVDVPGLPPADLREFVYAAAPDVDPADAGRLVAHYPNPLALQLFLGLDSTRRRIIRNAGALPISRAELAGLPREDVRDLYRAMWLELPKPIRRVCTLAAGVLPPHTALTYPFLPEIITAVGITIGDLHPADAADVVGRGLQAACDVHHWIVPVDHAGAYRFREAVLDDIAAESLDPTDRTDLTAAAITSLRLWIDVRRGNDYQIDRVDADERTLLVARWLWESPPVDGSVTEPDLAAGFLAANALGEAHQPAAARSLMNTRPWQNTYPTGHPAPLVFRSFIAGWAGQAGQLAAAITESWYLLDDMTRFLGPGHPHTLDIRNSLAVWLGKAGRVGEAIIEFRSLLADQTGVAGPDHPNTLTIRNNIADLLGQTGQLNDAITEFRLLLTDRIRVLGLDHPDTLATRGNLAVWLGEAGQLQDAITEAGGLLIEQARVLGRDHPNTLATRGNLAVWLGEAGQLQDAITEAKHVLAGRIRVLGPEHPETFSARSNLAVWLGKAGHLQEAIAEFRRLLIDRIRVLSPDHPHVLTARSHLADLLGQAGQPNDAIAELRLVLADRIRVLGPDHPDTLATRGNLSYWLGQAGEVQAAIIEARILLTDQTRVLGPDHPETLRTRNNLAYLSGLARRFEDAITELRLVLADRTRVLGPDHPDTLITRNNLAYLLGQTDQVQDAIVETKNVLATQIRIQGPDHPTTLITRSNLAYLLVQAGHVQEAVIDMMRILTDQTRILGPDHPDTRTTQRFLLSLLGDQSGRDR